MAISNPLTDGQMTPGLAGAAASTVSTSATVPSSSKVWAWVSYFNATATAPTMAGGGLTWTLDSTASNGSLRVSVFWADAPSGLASATTLTATLPTNSTSRFMAAAYSTGVATGVATARTAGTTGTTNWTSGALTIPNGSILIGGAYCDSGGNTLTDTASGGNTEIHDQNLSTDSAQTTVYQIGTGASIASQGSWSAASGSNTAIGVQFDAAATTAATPAGAPPVQIANRNVGPRALRQRFHRPVFTWYPAPTATIFNDSGSGTITLSGTATESHSHSATGSGTITLSGTRTESQSHTSSASGTITLSGTRTESQTGSRSGSGTITLSGTGTESYVPPSTFNDSGTGTITLSGTRTESQSHTSSASGTLTLSGTRTEAQSHTSTGTGTITLSGTGVVSHVYGDSRTGTLTLSGTGVQSFTHSGSSTGTILLSGTATESWSNGSSTVRGIAPSIAPLIAPTIAHTITTR